MRRPRLIWRLVRTAIICVAVSRVARAQDSLRILRIAPASPASPAEPVVVTFDHPVAPALDRSVNPRSAIRIIPAVGTHAHWQDPSTLVVEFDSLWTARATYRVELSATLRSADGLPLAMGSRSREVRVGPSVLLYATGALTGGESDTVVRPIAVMSAPIPLNELSGWLAPDAQCNVTESVPVRAISSRAIRSDDPYWIQNVDDRDGVSRGDSLRRVVELVSERALPFGCRGTIRFPNVPQAFTDRSYTFYIRARFGVEIECATGGAPRNHCVPAPIALRVNQPVEASAIAAHVRVDGRVPTVSKPDNGVDWIILPDPRPRTHHTVTVDGELRGVRGEALGADRTFAVEVDRVIPGVGLSAGVFIVPSSRTALVRIRHVNVDSVTVIVGRIADSSMWATLPQATSNYYRGRPSRSWPQLVTDSIVLQLPVHNVPDSVAIFDLRSADLPEPWRTLPVLAVRAVGVPASVNGEPSVPLRGARSPDARRKPGEPVRLNTISVVRDFWGQGMPYFAILRRTSIATHVWNSTNEVRVWVTGLRDAHPRPGAVVRVLSVSGREISSAVSDAEGIARLNVVRPRVSAPRAAELILETRVGGDVDVRVLPPSNIYEHYYDVDDDAENASARNNAEFGDVVHGAAFAERGIYRPGDQVFLKGMARRFTARAGYRVPRGDSARWVVRNVGNPSNSERIWSHDGRLGDFGTIVDSFTVPRTARLGGYTASLFVSKGGQWRVAATASFSVAEYRVPEFAVTATADSTLPLFVGDSVRVAISARYLFGTPMQGAKLEWWASTVERSPWELHVRGLDGFTVGRSWWMIGGDGGNSSPPTGPIKTVVSDRGIVSVPAGKLTRPGELRFTATVTDANRQQVTTELTLPVQVAEIYAGVRLARPQWRWPVGEGIPIQALTVDLNGRLQAGVSVRMLALRYEWDGATRRVDTVWQTKHITPADTLNVEFTPTTMGTHELLVVARDERGREASSSVVVWVNARERASVPGADRKLTLVANKPRYDVGDTARIHVEAPDEAVAWITLAHQGILSQRQVRLARGANELLVPIPLDAIPNAEVHVMALATAPPADTAIVSYWQGSTILEISHEPRALHVTLTPDATHYRPGDRVKLTVQVRDATGRSRRAETAVWAVDQGVVSLTGLGKPDLLTMLLPRSWYDIDFATSLSEVIPWSPPGIRLQFDDVMRLRGSAQLSQVVMGAEAGNGPIAVQTGKSQLLRQRFATTPFYRGSVVTDEQGVARLEFDLPDNLTTFRLFAAAVTAGVEAGSADTSIVSTRTLAVRPALPRIIRDGDVLEAGAVLTQSRAGRAPVRLRVEGTGIRLTGVASRTDTLDGSATKEIRFGMRGISADTAVLRFSGATATDSDAVEARLALSPAGHARARVVMGTLAGTANVAMSASEELDTLRSHLELQLGSSPLGVLHRINESLRLYPYLCTEQLSSAGRALVAKVRAEQMVEPTRALSAQDRRQLEMAVATLVERQQYGGGFGYWSATGWTSPWLTAYTVDFLVGARSLGIEVPSTAISRAADNLSALGRPYYLSFTRQDSLLLAHDELAAALMLRSLTRSDSALERRVMTARSSYSWLDRLSFAQLLIARGDSVTARDILTDAWRSAHTEGRRIVLEDSVAPRLWIFRSVLRPLVTLLTLTAALDPDDVRLGPLFESVLQVGSSQQRWGMNTIDAALTADAVTTMLRREHATSPTRVTVSGTLFTATVSSARADTLHLPLSVITSRVNGREPASIQLQASTMTPVYYAATLYEVPRARPVRADDEGISVERWYESYDSARPITSVKAGELVRVRVRVTVPADREFVVVDDALPAGLEAVDLSLRTSSALPPFAGAPRLRAEEAGESPAGQRWLYGSWDGGWWSPWEHREIRDDRVLFFSRQLWQGSYLVSYVARATTIGTFIRPPAHAEEMYNPAVHGRSDGGTFTVTP
jgi:uncharacterized protein YfaS (alpha-2-macroglobulin family)